MASTAPRTASVITTWMLTIQRKPAMSALMAVDVGLGGEVVLPATNHGRDGFGLSAFHPGSFEIAGGLERVEGGGGHQQPLLAICYAASLSIVLWRRRSWHTTAAM